MLHLFSQQLLQILFFSLGIYVLLLLLSDGEVNGDTKDLTELSASQCTYPVSHDRERPSYVYLIKYTGDDSATAESCQEWCNDDVNCRSVTYAVRDDDWHWCYKFNISIQELKDTGRDGEIYSETDTKWFPTYITFDRHCACESGFEPTSDNIYQCQPCNNSYYKPNISNDICQECPQDRPHTAMPGSISKENCTNLFCPPGKYQAENKTCVECPLHTYKEHNDTSKCLNCSSERPHTTMRGTISNDSCTNLFCPPGQGLAENKTCVECPPHTYKEDNGTNCFGCPKERPHTTMRGTVSKDSCTNLFCPPGIGLYGKVCKSCKVNEVSSNGTGPCIQPREGEEPNHDQSKFICSAGYGRNKTEDRCQKCQPGYSKSESGDRQCHLCPPNSLLIPGAITCEVDRGIQVEIVIGVLLGSVAVLAAAGFAVFLYCRKHRKRPKQSPETSSEEGEAKGNDYSDDYSGESRSSNSPTIVLSTSLSDTTVTTYSCTPTSDSKNTKEVSSTSWTPRERYILMARNEFFTEKGKENYVKDDKNDWDEGRNVDEGGDEDESKNGNVDEDDDGFVDEDEEGDVDEDRDGNVDVDRDGNVDEDNNGDVDEDENRNVDDENDGNVDGDRDGNVDEDRNGNVDEDSDKYEY